MASEILGLFGGKNPQQLQQDYLSNLSVSPGSVGNQGLLQQLISTGANAGTMMGYGAGRLLGGKVAGEVEASYLNEAIQAGQAGKTPAEKMKLVAAALEDKPGMGRQYMLALQEARKLEAEDFTMGQAKENARTKVIENPVTITDPITGKPNVVNTRRTVFDNGKRDTQGRVIWEERDGSAGTPTQPPPPAAGASSAQDQAKAALAKLNATPSAPPADNTLGGVIDAVGAKADMAPLNREADIERAGYNSAAAQVAQQDQRIKKMSDVQRLTPNVIRMIEASDARRILRDHFELLSDDQKRELRKRIASGRRKGYGHFKQAPPAER
jgi:hypothetical protein